jgi:ribosomal protein L11 methyltransferase
MARCGRPCAAPGCAGASKALAAAAGEHPTTSLCLRHLLAQRQQLKGLTVMDYGTGSGVLAIGAVLLGAAEAVGTDVDSLAVKAANRNAELNSRLPG